MSFDIIIFIVALGSLSLLVYIFFKIRDQEIIEKNENSKFEKKFEDISEELREVGRELTSVTTPINNLNRFLGGKVDPGRLGEWNLESIVRDIMPDGSYKFQFKINSKTDDKVDCAVLNAEGIYVPIDSKFYAGLSSNYHQSNNESDRKKILRDLKNAIKNDALDIAEKYILQNTTTNYAVLYIASERLLDLVDLIDDGTMRQEIFSSNKILIQGPNSLAALLDNIRAGHHYLKLNETAGKVANVVRDIQKEFSNFDNSTAKALKKLDLATKDVEALQTRVNVLGRKLDKGVNDLEDPEETK